MDLETLEQIPPWDWPQGTQQKLLEVLRDSDSDDTQRTLAASMAGDVTVVSEEIAGALLTLLGDDEQSDKLRGQAAIALGPVLELAHTDGFDDFGDAPIDERTFLGIQETLRRLYTDADVPRLVRRRVLETSIRARQDWHPGAVRAAFSSGDADWKLTAVFAMGWIGGFEEQILQALDSEDEEIHIEAVRAAGNWELGSAWSHVASLLTFEGTGKQLLLAAVDAAAMIRPQAVGPLIADLADSDDEEIAAVAEDAMIIADGLGGEEVEDE